MANKVNVCIVFVRIISKKFVFINPNGILRLAYKSIGQVVGSEAQRALNIVYSSSVDDYITYFMSLIHVAMRLSNVFQRV